MGSSEAKAEISLLKKTFAAGEVMQVNVLMDNSKCKKAVKSFKIKLRRHIECLYKNGSVIWSQDEEICGHKYAGVAEKAPVEQKTLEFTIPKLEKDFGAAQFHILQPGFDQMTLASSTETPMFRIEYSLQVFVKHDSKLEFGQGNSVNFNFEVRSAPQSLPEQI